MHYTSLGRSGVEVSRIILGTMNFGPESDRHASHAILDAAVDSGINFIDTADIYGGPPWSDAPGNTESILGEWITARRVRDRIVLATKIFGAMTDRPNDKGLSAYHIRRGVEASLRRLQTDHIDVMQMHHIDRSVPVDEVLAAFTVLRDQGKISYIGSSNFAGWNIAQYSEYAKATSAMRLTCEQSLYNLSQRQVELEVIPAALHYELGILAWSPLASGLLSGVLNRADRSRAPSVENLAEQRAKIERYEAFAAERNVSPATMGLAWLLHQPGVVGPIVGPRLLMHLETAIQALDVHLSQSDLEALDHIFPGPGGQAPEAYAW